VVIVPIVLLVLLVVAPLSRADKTFPDHSFH